jgi:hypothetical protein
MNENFAVLNNPPMLVFNSHMFFLRVFVSFVLASSTLGQSTAPHESELSTLADRLAHEIELPGKHAPSLKILVLDFPNQRGMANVLGERMSERLSDLLTERLGAEHVVAQSNSEPPCSQPEFHHSTCRIMMSRFGTPKKRGQI